MHQAYGIIGFPLGHSLSPYLHNQAFKKHGMDRCYFKWEIFPQDLPDFMRAVRILPLSGASVTIPFKQKVMPFLDEVSPEALKIGAVNTICLHNSVLRGANTDCAGFMAPIKGLNFDSALVLGAGGASRSVVYGLKQSGVRKISVSNRNPQKAENLAEEFSIQSLDWSAREKSSADILINTTPLGTAGEFEDKSPWEFEEVPFRVVYDLVYNPLQTRLLKQAEHAGAKAVSGLSMFVHQAREQFRMWTGQVFDSAWAEDILREKLAGR